jgi:hypothetical protein
VPTYQIKEQIFILATRINTLLGTADGEFPKSHGILLETRRISKKKARPGYMSNGCIESNDIWVSKQVDEAI